MVALLICTHEENLLKQPKITFLGEPPVDDGGSGCEFASLLVLQCPQSYLMEVLPWDPTINETLVVAKKLVERHPLLAIFSLLEKQFANAHNYVLF